MPCHSQPVDEEYALQLAAAFGIRTYKVDLSPAYDTLVSSISANGIELCALPAANIKPRLRMTSLYAIAQQHGYLVCGGGNRDEIMYGYFTKYGDSGVDLLPMADLLKGGKGACPAPGGPAGHNQEATDRRTLGGAD